MTQKDALKWIAARAGYARDYCGDENRRGIVAEIARVAVAALHELPPNSRASAVTAGGVETMQYDFTTQAQVRTAFWQGWPEGFKRGKRHNEYNATIRTEFVDFVDMLQKGGHISEALAQRVTL